jgi:uncharacterized protein (TIGR02246 family)
MTSSNSTPVRIATHAPAVRDVITAVGSAWAVGDVDAFAAQYAPDVTVVLPGGVHLQGRGAIRAFTAAGFAGPLKGSAITNDDVQVRMIGNDVAIAVSLGGTTMAGETEVAADRIRRATWVLSERAGTWLIEAYSTCPTGQS